MDIKKQVEAAKAKLQASNTGILDIVEIYNSFSKTKIVKFASITDAVKQTTELLEKIETSYAIPTEKKTHAVKHGVMYSYRYMKMLHEALKERGIEGYNFVMTTIGKNGDDGLLRDRIAIKQKGNVEPLGIVSRFLGSEDEVFTMVLNGKEMVIGTDVALVCNVILGEVSKLELKK